MNIFKSKIPSQQTPEDYEFLTEDEIRILEYKKKTEYSNKQVADNLEIDVENVEEVLEKVKEYPY